MLPAASLFLKALFITSHTINRLTVDNNVVRLSHGGDVRGTIFRSEEGKPFYAFLGIPYGEPPIGQLRFKASELTCKHAFVIEPNDGLYRSNIDYGHVASSVHRWAVQSELPYAAYFKAPVAKNGWIEEFDATKEGPICSQVDMFFRPGHFVGQEDCLTLNVYTPELPQEGKPHRKRDVIFYIHAGGFVIGSASTDFVPPERMMDAGNVLVTANYRLDALGFLSTGDEASPGNYGLLDQSLALQWVKDNIEAFGGNPESVTLFGHSAGAGSVSYHLISPVSKGLFHRALPMSGSALCPWAFEAKPLQWAQYVASEAGCPKEPSSELVDCLRTKPAHEFVNGFAYFGKISSFPLIFVPTVDGHFLEAPPYEVFFNRPETLNKVPVISGITEEEGAAFLEWFKIFKFNMSIGSDEFNTYALNASISGHFEDIIKDIDVHYGLSLTDYKTDEEKFERTLIKIYSDGYFRMDHYLEVQALAKAGVPVYAYSYDFHSAHMNHLVKVPKKYGAYHGADMTMYFDIKWFGSMRFNKRNRKMSKFLLNLLTTFAKTGIPDPALQYNPGWEPSTPTNIHILKIKETLSVKDYILDNPEQIFWTDVKKKIQEKKTQGN